MRTYLDTSVLLALLGNEAWSERASRFVAARNASMIISDFTVAEYAAGLARRVRVNEFSEAAATTAFEALDRWPIRSRERVTIAAEDIAMATTWLRRPDINLRAPDAIHLAAARRMQVPMATFDLGMMRAARTLDVGLAVL